MSGARPRYALGIDFGTESGRAAVFSLEDGTMLSSAVHRYANGVIDERLPDSGRPLGPDWALQDPADYLAVFREAGARAVREAGVPVADIIGVGIDFTACTMLPTLADGTPLSEIPRWRGDPNAWVKLWKHHAAQPQADRLNEVARQLRPDLSRRHGGRISSEWFFPKVMQIVEESPELYAAADRLIEACDWAVWQLTGIERRSACPAGYKALWDADRGFPDEAFFAALHPSLATVVDDKMSRDLGQLGERAGGLTARAADWLGLPAGTSVAVANLDAHVSVPACGVTEPGRMVMIMGTSTCHLVIGEAHEDVDGMCGVIRGGITRGTWGFEAGQSCVGDHFAWFAEQLAPAPLAHEAAASGRGIHAILEAEAAGLLPGESGLVALDWWNGNRSILVDADLTGVIMGMTLQTRPEEIYRALIEATAYGTRLIIETFEASGVPIHELVACGGLPDQSPLLMQIYADVTGREISVAAATQTPALGAAMHGAVAAGSALGGFELIEEAAARMGHLRAERYVPDRGRGAVYDRLYREYLLLHDHFGRGPDDAMKRLKSLRREQVQRRHAGAA